MTGEGQGAPEASRDESDARAADWADDGTEALPIGGWLARQRELREISLAELSERTRIPIRSLERLEAGAFDGNQDGFVRGFVRTVALDLGLDPDDAVARMLREPPVERRRAQLPRIPVQTVAAGLTLAVLFALVALGARWLFVIVSGSGAPAHAVVRHDPVRALAAAHDEVVGGLRPEVSAAPQSEPELGGQGGSRPSE